MIEMNSQEKTAWSYWLNCKSLEFSGINVHRNPRLNKSNQIIILVTKTGINISIPTINNAMIEKKLEQLKSNPLPSIIDVINLQKTLKVLRALHRRRQNFVQGVRRIPAFQ